MQLSEQDGRLFYRLYAALLGYAREKLGMGPRFSTSEEYTALPLELRMSIRDALFQHRERIDAFARDPSTGFSDEERAIVASWREALAGNFFVVRYLKKYNVFLSSDKPQKAYGVLALADPLTEVLGPNLPRWVTGVLLPFRNQIVYDGVLSVRSISFGPGIRQSLDEEYRQAKEAFGIITSLSPQAAPSPSRKLRAKKAATPAKAAGASPSHEAHEIASRLVQLTDSFCAEHLNEEYAELCRKLIEKLARKRPSPLLSGRLNGWAAGAIRAIGRVNFLDDRSQSPHMKFSEIDKAFGISSGTGAAKMNAILDALKIRQFDFHWTLPSQIDENPLIWMLEIDGFMRDARDTPREIQEIAFRKGLIPYIPADR